MLFNLKENRLIITCTCIAHTTLAFLTDWKTISRQIEQTYQIVTLHYHDD